VKLVRIGLVFALLLLFFVSVGWAKGGKPAKEPRADCVVTVDSWGSIDNEDGTSTWSFWVSEPDGPCNDLCNWAVALPEGAVVLGAEPRYYDVGVNSLTRDYSIKWHVTNDFESGFFTFTLAGSYSEGVVPYATKVGPTVGGGLVSGPIEGPPPTVG
jgi:hypothetical protein